MTRRQQQQQQQQDQQSRVFYELSALVLSLLRSPSTPIHFPADQSSSPSSSVALVHQPVAAASSSMMMRRSSPATQISPAGFASLMLGISMALMLCGSVTFFIGFLLMPWVLGLVMVLYVAGVVSSLSVLGRSILCYASPPLSSPRKDIPHGNYCEEEDSGVCHEKICLLKGTEERRSVVVTGVLHIGGGTNGCIGNSG